MTRNAQAFSLIELLVILTVIGIISTFAIPTYQNHLYKARLGKARQYMTSLNNTIANYYTNNGIIPTNAELNLPATVPASAAQYLHEPYLAYVTVAPVSTTASQCPYGVSTGYFSNYNGDYYADGTSPYVVLNIYFIDVNGSLNQECTYYEYDPVAGQPTRNQYFTDCILTNNPGSSAVMTKINSACP